MTRWLRVVLPVLYYLPLFIVVQGAVTALALYFEWRSGLPLSEFGPPIAAFGIVVLFGVVCYAVYRVAAFHPIANADYRNWLATTPWTSVKPLPWPVHLMPQDAVILGLICVLAWPVWGDTTPMLLQIFLAVYLFCLAMTHLVAGAWLQGYGVCFGLGVVVWQWQSAAVSLAAALVTYAVAYAGLRRSLMQFPWESRLGFLDQGYARITTGVLLGLGWPFGRLGPKPPSPAWSIPLHHGLLVSVLAGWWLFAAASLLPDRKEGLIAILFPTLLGTFLLPLVRMALYTDGYLPPISLGGRIVSGRWIIPGYDRVFVPTLLAMLIAAMLQGTGYEFDVDPLYYGPASLTLSLLITFGMGPGLQEWRLTGNHRIVEGSQAKNAIKVG